MSANTPYLVWSFQKKVLQLSEICPEQVCRRQLLLQIFMYQSHRAERKVQLHRCA